MMLRQVCLMATYTMSRFKVFALLIIALLFISKPASANHLFGGELFYTHVSGNTYKVTMILYGDCGNTSGAFASLATAQPAVEVYNGTSIFQTLALSPQPGSGVDVTPVCPDEANNTKCTNPANLLPGVKKFIYAANVTLTGPSTNWKFRSNGNLSNSQAGRSTTITNVFNPGPSLMSLEATLNNVIGTNSSPSYTTIPTPFFCINKPQEYNQGAVDADGDSLFFALVPGLNATSNPSTVVTYISPYTATAPLGCLPGSYTFNNNNGQLSFYPNIQQNALVVSQVAEYRNGVLIGTSMREMTFVVLNNCNNNPPDGTIINPVNGTVVNGTTIKTCKFDGTLSFGINTTDLDGDNVTLSYQGLPTGATATITNNSTPTPSFAFSWDITGVATGSYTFYVTFNDDGCPLSSKQTIAYTVQILPNPAMTYALIEHATCVKKGIFTVTPIGSDAPYTLNVTQGALTALVVNNITSTITDSVAAGTYNFRITGANGCYKDTTITIILVTNIVSQISWTQPYCPGGNTGTITVTATGPNPPMLYAVNALPYSTTTTYSGFSAGTHIIHIKDNLGCVKDSSITITNPPAMTLALGIRKPVCSPVSNGQITVTVTNGTSPYQYALNAGSYAASNTFTGLATGTYIIHVKDVHDCIKDTTVTLVDSMHMQLQSVVTQALCFGSASGTVTLNPSGTTAPYAYALGTGTFAAGNAFNNLAAGTYVFHIRDQNQCLKDTTITISQPSALAFTLNITPVLCFGASTGIVTVNATGGTSAYQYARDSNPYQAGNQLNGLNAGTHIIHLKDANNCIKDTTITITQPAAAVAFGTFSITNPTCEGFADGTVVMSAGGGIAPYQYAMNSNSFSTSPTFAQLQEGTYTFKVKDNNGCEKDTLVTLTGFPHILIDGVSFTEPSCYGFSDGQFTIQASGGNPPFTYQLGMSGIWSASPQFTNKNAKEYQIRIKDNNQCIKDTVIMFTQPDLLVLDTITVGNDCNGIDDGGKIEVLANGGTAPYQYFWLHDAGLQEAKITGLVNGRYYVKVSDAHACMDSLTIDILYNNCCTPYIPNAFTPNGDGNNDNYKVEYKGDMELKEMHIYNRYGQRIFSSANQNKTWDGTYNGQVVDNGTYYYYIRILCGNVRKKELTFKGDVTLIR
jgi:gliding motility-associated-like protein